MRINGWQRLWLLAAILWGVALFKLAGIPGAGDALFVVRLWVVPVVAVYAFGFGLAWVRRGFQARST